MDELIAFVRRCLDEDERVALAIQGDGYGDNDDGGWKHWHIEQRDNRPWPYLGALGMELAHSYGDNVVTPQRGEHITRWDPARVLAEVDAKRRILDRYEDALARQQDPEYSQIAAHIQAEEYEDWVIVALAQPYAGQDGWREEWRLSRDVDGG